MKSRKIKKLTVSLFVGLFFLGGVFFLRSSFLKDFFHKEAIGADLKQELFITGENYYGRGGLFSYTSKNEVSLNLGAYNMEGDAIIDVYRVNIDYVLNSFVYDEKGKQINIPSDFSKMEKVTSFYQYIISNKGKNSPANFSLPLEESGIWLVRASLNGVEAKAFVIKSNIGALVKEGDNKMIFWTQNISDKKSLSDVDIKVYNLQNRVKERYHAKSNHEGILETAISSKDDVAVIEKKGEVALIPINFTNLNTEQSFKSFVEKTSAENIFTFTDRPLYSPGDKVYFKSIIREDDDARYSIKEDQVEVEVFRGWGDEKEIIGKKKYNISTEGAISGEFELPKDLKNGHYTLGIVNDKDKLSSDYYGMGPYRSDYLSQISFNVEYYQKPEYEVRVGAEKDEIISGDELSFLVEGVYFSGHPISNQEFEYKVYSSDFYEYAYRTELSDYGFRNNFRYGYRGGNLVAEGKENLNSQGQFELKIDSVIPDDEKRKSQIFAIEVELKDSSGNQSFDRKNVLVRAGEFGIYRDNKNYDYGHKMGDEIKLPVILDPKFSDKELEGRITRNWWEKEVVEGNKYSRYRYNKKEESYPLTSVKTDSNGRADFYFTPTQEGSYTVTLSGFDSRKNRVTKDFSFWVSGSDGYYSGNGEEQGLTIKANKEEYTPTDNARLTIYSEIPDRDVFVSLERGRVDRYKVIHLNGHREVLEMPLVESDMPNMFASVESFSDLKMQKSSEKINLSTESKKIKILLTPNKSRYESGDTVEIEVKTTDYKNNPISTDMAVWLVDKALFELMDSNTGDVFEKFWRERYNSTSSSHSLIGISGDLAEKGGGGGGGREVFKDTAYWNAKVKTDESGYAKISFELPDNLTTWVLAGIGATRDTKVGQVTNEIKVTKDVVIRPVLPNILRISDDVVISALAQNFTDKNRTFDVKMEFDSGEVENANQKVELKPGESKQIYWKTKPNKENEVSKIKFSLIGDSSKNSDIVTKNIPIRKSGFWETRADIGGEKSEYRIDLSKDADLDKTKISLSLSSTMLGSLPSSMKYLIGYPYGCIEQTTSRFVPVVISKENPELLKDSIGEKNLDEFMEVGVKRLAEMQGEDGGWGWWGGNSSYFISAYVTEYLIRAKAVGANVDEDVLNKAKKYFQQEIIEKSSGDHLLELNIIRAYALSFFGERNIIENFNQDISPDILALAVISNTKNGFNDPSKNGRDKLMSLAQKEGEGKIYWKEGNIDRFGSIDASTGLALHAFIMAGGDRETASKAVRFLTEKRSRHYWSNTFATVQSVQALIDFSKIERMIFPNYKYTVKLDGAAVAKGVFDNKNWEDEIILSAGKVKNNSASLSIEKSGEGHSYSELLVKEFRLNDSVESKNNGIEISRKYTNEKGENYSIGVGDIVNVGIELKGDFSKERFLAIEDQLPAGMVPINPVFKNSQFNERDTDATFGAHLKEITENKVVLAMDYYNNSNNRWFRYKARVVSEGEFQVPPTEAVLMYSPDVNGRSGTQKIKIEKKSEKLFDYPKTHIKSGVSGKKIVDTVRETNPVKILAVVFVLIYLLVSGWVIYKKVHKKE